MFAYLFCAAVVVGAASSDKNRTPKGLCRRTSRSRLQVRTGKVDNERWNLSGERIVDLTLREYMLGRYTSRRVVIK